MRKRISTRCRFEIFKRDKFVCQYCGQSPPAIILHVDHIIAVANGGGDEMENLITSCQACNLGKSDVPINQVSKPLKERLNEDRERAQQLKEYNAMLRELRSAKDENFKIVSDALMSAKGNNPDEWQISGDWAVTARTLLRRLPAEMIVDAVRIADEKIGFKDREYKAFKYFCGVCWNMVHGVEGTERRGHANTPA